MIFWVNRGQIIMTAYEHESSHLEGSLIYIRGNLVSRPMKRAGLIDWVVIVTESDDRKTVKSFFTKMRIIMNWLKKDSVNLNFLRIPNVLNQTV